MTEREASQEIRGDGSVQAAGGSTVITSTASGTATAISAAGPVTIINPDPHEFRRRFWRRVRITIWIVVLVVAAVAVAYWLINRPPTKKLNGATGEWLYDAYVGLLIPKQTVGTLLSEENYDLDLDLENRTSMALEVTKIEVEKYNHDAGLVFGLDKDLVHTGTDEVPKYVSANGKVTVSITGNQFLPRTAIVKIYHTLSGEPSVFEVDLGGKRMPMPSPRQLPVKGIYRGTDALRAIADATPTATAWGKDVTIVAVFPGDHEIFIDPGSRLKFAVVKNWVVTFYSFTLDRLYTAIVKEGKIEGKNYPRTEADFDLPERVAEPPLIGNQTALAIANQDNLLCADWKEGPHLDAIKVDGTWKTAWFLPYRGPDSLPIIVDAKTGDLIAMHGAKEFVGRTSEMLAPERMNVH